MHAVAEAGAASQTKSKATAFIIAQLADSKFISPAGPVVSLTLSVAPMLAVVVLAAGLAVPNAPLVQIEEFFMST